MTNCLFVESARACALPAQVACWGYEIWAPLLNNAVVDVSDMIDRKKAAMQAYQSQFEDIDYPRVVCGLNAYRSLMCRQGTGFAEGFYMAQFDIYRGIYGACLVH